MQSLDPARIPSSAVPGPATVAESAAPPVTERIGVLVVDDDNLVRIMVQLGLERHGFDVWQASNRREASCLYQEHRDRITVVLLDVRRPGLDGPATMDVLRKHNPAVPFCFMSGETGGGLSEELSKQEAVYFIAKPFLIDHLANVLRLIARGVPANQLPSGRICRT